MKSLKFGILALALTILVQPLSFGQTASTNKTTPAAGMRKHRSVEVGGAQDTVSPERKAAAKARMMQRFDSDHDGTLSPQEREAMKAFKQKKKAERQARLNSATPTTTPAVK